jgi:hypothetical protein
MVTIQQMEAQIDVTKYDTVLKHVATDPNIEFAINVEDCDLAEIGALAVNGDMKAYVKLLNEEKLSIRQLDKNAAVDVLYLPPIYFYKDLKKIYR